METSLLQAIEITNRVCVPKISIPKITTTIATKTKQIASAFGNIREEALQQQKDTLNAEDENS